MILFLRFIAAVASTYLLGAILVSQSNLARIVDLGLPVSVTTRLQSAAHDVSHMLGLYLPLIAVALLLGFLVAGQIVKRSPAHAAWLYPLAGFCALVAMHLLMQAAFGLTPIAPTRTGFGLLLQGLCGAAGAGVFYLLGPYSGAHSPGGVTTAAAQ